MLIWRRLRAWTSTPLRSFDLKIALLQRQHRHGIGIRDAGVLPQVYDLCGLFKFIQPEQGIVGEKLPQLLGDRAVRNKGAIGIEVSWVKLLVVGGALFFCLQKRLCCKYIGTSLPASA